MGSEIGHFCFTQRVGGWVRKSPIRAYVIFEWFPINKTEQSFSSIGCAINDKIMINMPRGINVA